MDIKQLLSKMTLEQKLAQMSQFNAICLMPDSQGGVTGPARSLDLTESELAAVGSTLNFIGAEEMIKIQDMHLAQDPLKIPLLFMQDVVHGYRTIYPIPLAMGATFDPDLMQECASMAAKESAVAGVNVTFGPMVDLCRDARWGRNMESTGEDPYLNCLMSAAQVKGFQGDMTGKYDIAACVKHFAAYGGAEAGRDYNTVDVSERNLRDYYFPAYKAAVDAGVEMVMTSFNLINGVPSSGNKWLVDGVLRKEWGFDKIVISDYNAFREMKVHGYCESDKDCAYRAIEGGSDIEMMSPCYLKHIPALIEEGKVSMEQIDKAVLRILELKNKMGLFENPYRSASVEEQNKFFLCDEHRDICRKAAEKAAVLLKNDGVLPLCDKTKSIAVIGPFANVGMIGFWSCAGKEEEATTVLQGIKKLVPNAKVEYAEGCDKDDVATPCDEMIAKAVEVAKNASVAVLCLGEHRTMAGEGNSRSCIGISEAQKTLIKKVKEVCDKVVVVLFNGRPLVITDFMDDANAILTMWQPGTEGGSACANLLFGKTNFEGRLPMSFPYTVGQCPIYYNNMRTGRPLKRDFKTSGYTSRYMDAPNAPLFPFGYGLSYTNFEISEPQISATSLKRGGAIKVSATVKNTGKEDGVALVQMYINDCVASLVRPVKEMKGFEKVSLRAGEEKTVEFTITEDMLIFWSANGKFETENGDFAVFVGLDASENRSVKFTLCD